MPESLEAPQRATSWECGQAEDWRQRGRRPRGLAHALYYVVVNLNSAQAPTFVNEGKLSENVQCIVQGFGHVSNDFQTHIRKMDSDQLHELKKICSVISVNYKRGGLSLIMRKVLVWRLRLISIGVSWSLNKYS